MKKNLNPIYEALQVTRSIRKSRPGFFGKIVDAFSSPQIEHKAEDFISHKLARRLPNWKLHQIANDRHLVPRFLDTPQELHKTGKEIASLVSPKRWAKLKAEAERELQEYSEKIRKQFSINPDYAQMVEDKIAQKREELLKRAREKLVNTANKKLYTAAHDVNYGNVGKDALVERTRKRIEKYKALAEKYGKLNDPESKKLAEKYRRLADKFGSLEMRYNPEWPGQGSIEYFK